MKKLVGITGIILLICLMLSTFFVPVSSAQSVKTANNEQSIAEVYILKAENNRVVVYKKGESTPYIQTDTRCDMLPKGDVVYLEKGIELEGREALRKALEDYCS